MNIPAVKEAEEGFNHIQAAVDRIEDEEEEREGFGLEPSRQMDVGIER